MDYVSLWGASNEIERIAGNQGQRGRPLLPEYAHIVLADHLYPIDNVGLSSAGGFELDGIAYVHVLQSSKKSVAMACNTDISWFTNVRHPVDSARTAIEDLFIGSLIYGNLQMDFVYLEQGDRVVEVFSQALLVGLDTLRIPKAVIDRLAALQAARRGDWLGFQSGMKPRNRPVRIEPAAHVGDYGEPHKGQADSKQYPFDTFQI